MSDTQQNALLVQESSAADSLEEQATKLQQLVDVLRLPSQQSIHASASAVKTLVQRPSLATASGTDEG